MPAFVFATCLPRSATWLKRELARTRPDLRLAYSRPGLLTMRTDTELDDPEPRSPFVRASGRSLGMAADVAAVVPAIASLTAERLRLHVFARDPMDPDRTPEDPDAVPRWREPLLQLLGDRVHEEARALPGDVVIDVVLPPPGADDPALVGWHVHDDRRGDAPGGVRRVPVPDDVPSRAYAKMEEALAWSRLPLRDGEVVVEIGAAPGGAALSLLQHGADVIGIDPARMDERVLAFGRDGRFRHLGIHAERVRTRDLPAVVDWLVLDANVAPHRAMTALAHLLALRRDSIRGLLLTLKLNDDGVVDDLPRLFEKVAELAELPDVGALRATQLPSAHREVVVWAERRRAGG